MSELTQCNYCTLRQLRRRAKSEGQKLTLRGNNVYIHPPEVDPGKPEPSPEFADTITGTMDSRESPYFVAWLMEIPAGCCC